MPASFSATATPISAWLMTTAVCARPIEDRQSTRSLTSLMTKLRISIPILPTSGDATSRTREAKRSRSWQISSTVRVPAHQDMAFVHLSHQTQQPMKSNDLSCNSRNGDTYQEQPEDGLPKFAKEQTQYLRRSSPEIVHKLKPTGLLQ